MKIIYAFILLLCLGNVQAQVSDIVTTGSGYANQIWYSLENDEQGSAPKEEWDIAFSVDMFSSSIHINGATGVMLYTNPNGDISNWSDVIEEAEIATWNSQYNSATSWESGAFDRNVDTGNPMDFGWGVYNFITHFVVGDSMFVIQLANQEYKKLKINELSVSGVYSFTYANLDGSNEVNATITKSDYAGKNFAYYSIENQTALDREPLSGNWDLLFTQYTDYIPVPYTVAGVLHNKQVQVAQVDDVDQNTFDDYSAGSFVEAINEIGYDWKTFGGMGFNIEANRVYFVQENGNIWKLVFTGFGGSATGTYEFTKELLATVNVDEMQQEAYLSTFPNPNADGNFQLVTSGLSNENYTFCIYDLQGKEVFRNNITLTSGLQVTSVHANLQSGMYVGVLFVGNTISSRTKIQVH